MSKSQMRRAKEKEGGELETLNFRGFLYLIKKVDKHQRDCTAPGANIHADFDWDYELRKGMSEFANMHVENTSGSKIASDFRNKLGKDGLFTITNCKHYSMASRAANVHGKCVWTMLLAAITYPGCPEWCRYTWGQIKRTLVELGFTEKWLKKERSCVCAVRGGCPPTKAAPRNDAQGHGQPLPGAQRAI